MAGSPAVTDELKYLYASNVNVSNFVSEKLSSDDNYPLWKAQMLCLMESHQMRGIVDNLFDDPGATNLKIVKQYDSLLKGWIFGSLTPYVLKAVVDLQSARDVWWKLQSIYDQEKRSEQDASEEFIQTEISSVTEPETIDTGNRNFQLREATVKGSWWEAEAILKNDQQAATEAIDDDGNTMLHLAVKIGQNGFVKELLDFIDDGEKIGKKNSDGHTALHVAAIVGNIRAAGLLVEKRKELVGISDYEGLTPLLSAYYNTKLDTFAYLVDEINSQSHSLGFSPGLDLPSRVNFLITLIFTRRYDLASKLVKEAPEMVTRDDKVLMALVKTFPSELGLLEAMIYPSLNSFHQKLVKRCSLLFHSYAIAEDILWAKTKSKLTFYRRLSPKIIIILLVPVAILYAIHQLICIFILMCYYPLLMLHFLMWKSLTTVVDPIKHIDRKERAYIQAKIFLKLVCDHIDHLNISGFNHPCYNGPIIEAACQGSAEIIREILVRSPKTIASRSSKEHNLIQMAILNRSEKVYNCICPFFERMDLSILDSSKNNLLHLAGRLAPSNVLSSIPGAAMQLQRELNWFKEVQKFMSPTQREEKNIHMETPYMVFTREHTDLIKEGEIWMKKTSESCSITAALNATIVFAAAITVPGGSNQETGIPLFRNEIAFTIFAVSDAISFFASASALLVFLSILTAVRYSELDFLVRLPRRLMIGVCTLILSTVALIVAFSAILYLVFCDQKTWMLSLIGGTAFFPIAVAVILEFPLAVNLFLATYRPIVLDDCDKSNMNKRRSSFTKQ